MATKKKSKKGPRGIINLQCTACKEINYHTEKNKRNTPDKVELAKFCARCKAKTAHKEMK